MKVVNLYPAIRVEHGGSKVTVVDDQVEIKAAYMQINLSLAGARELAETLQHALDLVVEKPAESLPEPNPPLDDIPF